MKHIIFLFTAALVFSCTTTSSKFTEKKSSFISVVQEPFTGDFINDTTFRINPSLHTTLETPNGSSVVIPANALIDENGKLVSENVTITFKQYHSILDIITSGIPMD